MNLRKQRMHRTQRLCRAFPAQAGSKRRNNLRGQVVYVTQQRIALRWPGRPLPARAHVSDQNESRRPSDFQQQHRRDDARSSEPSGAGPRWHYIGLRKLPPTRVCAAKYSRQFWPR